MPNIQMLNPASLAKPLAAYSNIARVKASEFLFIAGQIGNERDGKIPTDFESQCAQVFANIGAALASQGAGFANIVAFTSYLFAGGPYPPNTLLIVDRLVHEELLVEVSAIAAL